MWELLNNKESYFFWGIRYSLIQIGIYSASLFSSLLYLLPVINNDLLLFSYLISSITLQRSRIYINDVLAFFSRKSKKQDYINIFLKKIIIIIFIAASNAFIYLSTANINILNSFLITICLIIGTYVSYLNNYDLHILIRGNSISKINLFLFGFFPRLITLILLIIYILFAINKDPFFEPINLKILLISGMYFLPPTLSRIILLKKLKFSAKTILQKIKLKSSDLLSNKDLFKEINLLKISNLNIVSQILLNISFLMIMIKTSSMIEGNIFKLPVSIMIFLNFVLLVSRIKAAKKYNLESPINKNRKFMTFTFLTISMIFLKISLASTNIYTLYGIALFYYLINIIIINLDREIL